MNNYILNYVIVMSRHRNLENGVEDNTMKEFIQKMLFVLQFKG